MAIKHLCKTVLVITLPTVLGALMYSAAACHCICSDTFTYTIIKVVDENGHPVTDATVTSVFKDSGTVIECSTGSHDGEGTFCIMSDNYVDNVSTEGTNIEVTVEKENYQTVVEEFIFNTDSCHCHINCVSGNTQISLLPGS